jgi:protein-S-isoprenylcysteine O-methyltransferase Ste14
MKFLFKHIGLFIGALGWGILFNHNWVIAIGVGLAMWGYEMQLRSPAEEESDGHAQTEKR